VRDRARYRAWAGAAGDPVAWVDITGREEALRRAGIDPKQALTELHVVDAAGAVYRELDAYILLIARTTRLRPLAWVIGLPGIRPVLSWCYPKMELRRLRLSGRLLG
jgi:predicted DCC family thiol-disulfide oxidoreductase YuxK